MSDILVLRVERPYASEAELLQLEAWTITKKSLFLIGVTPHPEGERVRCELVLESGVQLLVAEGVVAKHMARTGNRPQGLVVRFRRMSAASNQFVNRALSVRETTEASSPSAADPPPPSSEVGNFEPPSFDFTTMRPMVAGASVANESERVALPRPQATSEALSRLTNRTLSAFSVPKDRESAIDRLRVRSAGAERL